ncbi:MAG TPA: exodeoxyribonuclease VII small subunit [Verrucomicrobiae bacterium]|nr:exodeoxyribonuclease VII small subunit [Verrucomicrobiae bacterium]
MSSAPKNAGPNNPAQTENLPFEQALKKLEAIVEDMETNELPLDTLLARYQEGTLLAKICQNKLAEAEVKIQVLEKKEPGPPQLKPFPGPKGD